MKKKPTVSDRVHYYDDTGAEAEPLAAIVTQVYEEEPDLEQGRVALAVFTPTGIFFEPEVPYSEQVSQDHWTWPSHE